MKKDFTNVFLYITCTCVFLLLFVVILSDSMSIANAESVSTIRYEPKHYSDVEIDDDFDDSCVLVVIDKSLSGINRSINASLFKDIRFNQIEDLSSLKGDISKKQYLNKDDFRQIIRIELIEKTKKNVINTIKLLEKIPGIVWAGPNTYDYPAKEPTSSSGTNYPLLWGMHGTTGIQAKEAWNMTVGVKDSVRVGIIDSGIAEHEDLNQNVVAGWDFYNNNEITTDDVVGHGTHVAGTIGAVGTNANGIVGVAWNVQLVPLQVTDASGKWPIASVTKAINWAIDNNIDIINYSGGGTTNNYARKTAIKNYKGLFVCAAGNENKNNDEFKYYPSDYSQGQSFSNRVISVGAITSMGRKASYSNYGNTTVSIFAPGDQILSTIPTTISASGYGYMSGTSMATPHVTGTAALMFTYYSHMLSGLTRAEKAANIKSAIIQSATVDSEAPVSGLCVAGARLNAHSSLCKITYNTTNTANNCIRVDSLKHAFYGYLPIPSQIYDRDVTEIGDWAFNNQGNISQIDVPESVKKIGANAFQNCSYMTKLVFADNSVLNEIGNGAFYNCGSLKSISIPNEVTAIGANTFENCYSLSYVIFKGKENLRIIGNSSFANCASLRSIGIPKSTTTIGFNAFENCSALVNTNITLDSTLSRIENAAFSKCASLENIVFPASLSYLGNDSFYKCSNLKSVTILDSLSTICENTFSECQNLTIYTTKTVTPTNWQPNWNPLNRPTVWGCAIVDNHIMSFEKKSNNPTNHTASNGINNPHMSNYTFDGWYVESDYSGTQYTDLLSAPNGMLYAKWIEPSCIAQGTLVTLSNGTQKPVEELSEGEKLLVWNLFTGSFDTAPILFLDYEPQRSYEIIQLNFSDGTEIKIIDEHAFWDYNLNKYVFIRNDATQYIGHWFNKQKTDENGTLSYLKVQLIGVDTYTETTTAWSPVTYMHLCLYVNGMLSIPGATEGLINIFEVNQEIMKYDEVSMERDIANYGLFSYLEFNNIVPVSQEMFQAFNGQFLKVAIGKGLISIERLVMLVERYSNYFEG